MQYMVINLEVKKKDRNITEYPYKLFVTTLTR